MRAAQFRYQIRIPENIHVNESGINFWGFKLSDKCQKAVDQIRYTRSFKL
jgi:hypothetical protein